MKKINYLLCTIAIGSACLQVTAQDKAAQDKAKQDKEMAAWMSYMTPGPMHEMLAKSNGDWNEEVTMWMDPAAPPTKSTSTCTNQMILGGRYQESLHMGSFNGMPFEGRGLLAYDNAKKIFISTWVDNMGTGIMYTQGTWDEKTKTCNFKGVTVDPMTGKDMPVREVFKIIDDNTQTFEMYMTQNGKETKSMAIKYTRKM